jgi:hypothetical protein
MEYIRQTIGSDKLIGIFDIPPTLRNKEVEVIILSAENDMGGVNNGKSCNIGCYPNLPELPESFFEPLPEEDLQAWGL